MNKLFYFDLETTGLSFTKCAIHQLSAIIEIDGEVKEIIDLRIKPFEGAIIDSKALDIANITTEQINAYDNERTAYNDLTYILSKYIDKYDKKDKFFLVGYNNASFDNNFLRQFFGRNNDKYFGSWFWSGSLDVFILSAQALKNQRQTMPNFKLSTVFEKVTNKKVNESELHDALYDVRLTHGIYKELTKQS